MNDKVKDSDETENLSGYKTKQFNFFHKIKYFVNGYERYFLMTLVGYANYENACWRSAKTYAYEMGVSEKTVRRAIAHLKELEIITVKTRKKVNGHYHSSYCKLNFNCKLLDVVTETTSEQHRENGNDEIAVEVVSQTDGMWSHSPQDMVAETNKYKENKKRNTGGQSSPIHVNDMGFFSDKDPNVMDYWFFIKGFVNRNNKRALPSMPSEGDIEAIEWVIENFPVDPRSKKDCIAICKFVIKELGESEQVLNPFVRLKLAAEENQQGIHRFLGGFKEWRKN